MSKPETTNTDRAEWASAALEAYCAHNRDRSPSGADRMEAIGDLIGDLCHLLDQCGERPFDFARKGIAAYLAETNSDRTFSVTIRGALQIQIKATPRTLKGRKMNPDNMMRASSRWPNLITYINNRNGPLVAGSWCEQLHADERAALAGGYADIAAEFEAAQAAYTKAQEAKGLSSYPYNSAMIEFLGLPPGHGYYMAGQVAEYYRLGEAQRAIRSLIDAGRSLKIVAARDRATREPVRFYTFKGEQIKLEGGAVTLTDAKRKIRLSSNWSVSSCLVAVRAALQTGDPYGAK